MASYQPRHETILGVEVKNQTVGGFYEFDSVANAQNYIDGLLLPFAKKVNGNLTVKLFDGEITREANIGMNSPYYSAA